MAAEAQPRFIRRQPTHLAAWEGTKSGQGPLTAPPNPEGSLGWGVGPGWEVDPVEVGSTAQRAWLRVQTPLYLFQAA